MPDAPDGRTPGQLSTNADAPRLSQRPALIVVVVVAALLAIAFVVWQTNRSDAESDQDNAIREAIAAQSNAAPMAPPTYMSSAGSATSALPARAIADPDQPAPDVEVAQEGQPFVVEPHFAQCVDGQLPPTVCDQPVFSDTAVKVTVTSMFGASSAGDVVAAPGFTLRSFDAKYVTKRKGDPTGMSWKVTRDGADIDKGDSLKQTQIYSTDSNGPGFISFTVSVHDSPTTPEGDAATVLELADNGKTIWRFRLDDATELN